MSATKESPASKSLTRMRLTQRAADVYKAEKIGVALGPGLPIGLVGVGLLIALEQLKIKISMISGTSMGAVIGALYASGLTPEEIRECAIELFAPDGVLQALSNDANSASFGASTGERLVEELKQLAGWDPEFYELRVPLFVVASDKVSQQKVILRHGRVFDAVCASLAMPLVMTEKEMGGMRLADGSIFAPLDTEVLYGESADFVWAMQAKPIQSEKKRKLPLGFKRTPKKLRELGWQVTDEVYFGKPACEILLRLRVPETITRDNSCVEDIVDLGVKIVYEAFTEIEKGNFSGVDLQSVRQVESSPLELLNEAEDIELYLSNLESRVGAMTDAELTEEFPKFARRFVTYLQNLNAKYPDHQSAGEAIKMSVLDLGKIVEQNPFMSRCLEKPRGYAGDYQMMNYLYDNEVFNAPTNLGKMFNFMLFLSPAGNAVKNRAKLIQGIIQQRVTQLKDIAIASIACGPAREVADSVTPFAEKEVRIRWTLLDQDRGALEYARASLPDTKMLVPNIVTAGVRDLIKRNIALGSQDIIYSLGLFDYLEDKVAIVLISRLYSELKPGGLLLIGNFDKSNWLRAWMEAASEWFLIHRTGDDLLQLAKSAAPDGRHFVMAEPEGVNLILVTSKPLEANL